MGKTVRVRIAVAIDENGDWIANGDRKELRGRIKSEVLEWFAEAYKREAREVVWVEAYVPIPSPTPDSATVEGKVANA